VFLLFEYLSPLDLVWPNQNVTSGINSASSHIIFVRVPIHSRASTRSCLCQ